MEKHIEQFILQANSKALATFGSQGLNVVPISSVKIVDGQIWLINYFMEKTLENILENQEVALVCWSGMFGYQIKGQAVYVEEGESFEQAKQWVKEILPERIVKGLVIITPKELFDIAPTKNTAEFNFDLKQ
jgi:predicted pyridoxine 5'-phosphate oxidase superfamily flavin-nucleotide-binding protein